MWALLLSTDARVAHRTVPLSTGLAFVDRREHDEAPLGYWLLGLLGVRPCCCWRVGVHTRDMLHARKLQQREQSKGHQDALRQALGLAVEPVSAPTVDEFRTIFEHVRKNPIGAGGVLDVAGWKKCRKMVWCLAEAHHIMKRRLWKGHVSATLFQDGRKGKLTVRFSVANSWQRRNGC